MAEQYFKMKDKMEVVKPSLSSMKKTRVIVFPRQGEKIYEDVMRTGRKPRITERLIKLREEPKKEQKRIIVAMRPTRGRKGLKVQEKIQKALEKKAAVSRAREAPILNLEQLSMKKQVEEMIARREAPLRAQKAIEASKVPSQTFGIERAPLAIEAAAVPDRPIIKGKQERQPKTITVEGLASTLKKPELMEMAKSYGLKPNPQAKKEVIVKQIAEAEAKKRSLELKPEVETNMSAKEQKKQMKMKQQMQKMMEETEEAERLAQEEELRQRDLQQAQAEAEAKLAKEQAKKAKKDIKKAKPSEDEMSDEEYKPYIILKLLNNIRDATYDPKSTYDKNVETSNITRDYYEPYFKKLTLDELEALSRLSDKQLYSNLSNVYGAPQAQAYPVETPKMTQARNQAIENAIQFLMVNQGITRDEAIQSALSDIESANPQTEQDYNDIASGYEGKGLTKKRAGTLVKKVMKHHQGQLKKLKKRLGRDLEKKDIKKLQKAKMFGGKLNGAGFTDTLLDLGKKGLKAAVDYGMKNPDKVLGYAKKGFEMGKSILSKKKKGGALQKTSVLDALRNQ